MKYYIIPNLSNLDKALKYSKEYNLGFEYNDFFNPDVLDDENLLKKSLLAYKNLNRLNDTFHGVFYDICLNSNDAKIRKISEMRVEESIKQAKELNCKGVVFHTNYIDFMAGSKIYKESYLKLNSDFYVKMANKYDIDIYLENMFDQTPDMLYELVKRCNHKKINVCLDFAHANISKTPIDDWFNKLKPYIKHIHLNDNDGLVDSHSEIGTCNIDFKHIKELINKLNDDTSILIEISDIDIAVKSYLNFREI